MGRGKVGTGKKKVAEEKSRAKRFALDISSPTFFFARSDFSSPTPGHTDEITVSGRKVERISDHTLKDALVLWSVRFFSLMGQTTMSKFCSQGLNSEIICQWSFHIRIHDTCNNAPKLLLRLVTSIFQHGGGCDVFCSKWTLTDQPRLRSGVEVLGHGLL